jgi:hypothetical protein
MQNTPTQNRPIRAGVTHRLEQRAVEARALAALRQECAGQDEVNALLWAMVASLKAAKKDVH